MARTRRTVLDPADRPAVCYHHLLPFQVVLPPLRENAEDMVLGRHGHLDEAVTAAEFVNVLIRPAFGTTALVIDLRTQAVAWPRSEPEPVAAEHVEADDEDVDAVTAEEEAEQAREYEADYYGEPEASQEREDGPAPWWDTEDEPVAAPEAPQRDGDGIERTCVGCGGTFIAERRRGRPPVRCEECRA